MNAEHGETEGDESPEAEENVSPKQVFNRSDIWELKPNRSIGMAGTYHSYIGVCVYDGWFCTASRYVLWNMRLFVTGHDSWTINHALYNGERLTQQELTILEFMKGLT